MAHALEVDEAARKVGLTIRATPSRMGGKLMVYRGDILLRRFETIEEVEEFVRGYEIGTKANARRDA